MKIGRYLILSQILTLLSLQEGIESGDPGTDDGRFYFHLGDAMQRVGNKEVMS